MRDCCARGGRQVPASAVLIATDKLICAKTACISGLWADIRSKLLLLLSLGVDSASLVVVGGGENTSWPALGSEQAMEYHWHENPLAFLWPVETFIRPSQSQGPDTEG